MCVFVDMGAGLYNTSKCMATSDLITIVTPERRIEEPGIGRTCLSQSLRCVIILLPCPVVSPGVLEEQVQILLEAEREQEAEQEVEQEVEQVQILQEVEPEEEEEEAIGVLVSQQSPPTHHRQDTKVSNLSNLTHQTLSHPSYLSLFPYCRQR